MSTETGGASPLSNRDWVSLHGFAAGTPVVDVIVGDKKKLYKIPQDFLCRHSKYFQAVFEGGFKEGIDRISRLDDIGIEPFEHILRWISTGDVVLNNNDQYIFDTSRSCGQYGPSGHKLNIVLATNELLRLQVSEYLEFLIAADFLLITPNPATVVMEKIRTKVVAQNIAHPIEGKMLAKIFSQLPASHPVREFFAKVFVLEYFRYEGYTYQMPGNFVYQNELDSIPDFAAQLKKAAEGVIIEQGVLDKADRKLGCDVKCPVYNDHGTCAFIQLPLWYSLLLQGAHPRSEWRRLRRYGDSS